MDAPTIRTSEIFILTSYAISEPIVVQQPMRFVVRKEAWKGKYFGYHGSITYACVDPSMAVFVQPPR